jgi:hypothetical protein
MAGILHREWRVELAFMLLAGVPASEFAWWSSFEPLLRGDPEPAWRCLAAAGLTLGILLAGRPSAREPRRARRRLIAFVLLLAPLAALERESAMPLLTASVAGTLAFLTLLDCERRAVRDPSASSGEGWPLWPAFVVTPLWLLLASMLAWQPPRSVNALFVAAWNAQDRAELARFSAEGTEPLASELDTLAPVVSRTHLGSKDDSDPTQGDWMTFEYTLADESGLLVWFERDEYWSARALRTPRALELQLVDFDAALRAADLEKLRRFASSELLPGSLERLASASFEPFLDRRLQIRARGEEVDVDYFADWTLLLSGTWLRQPSEGWRLTELRWPE